MLFKHTTNLFSATHAQCLHACCPFFSFYTWLPRRANNPQLAVRPTRQLLNFPHSFPEEGMRDSSGLSSGSLGTILHPRFTQITGGTAMRRLPVFISLVGVLILMSGNATQPAQAQNTLPRFNLVGNAVMHEDRLGLTVNERLHTGAAWLPDKQQVQDGFEATF